MTDIPIKTTSFELGYGQEHSEDLGVSPANFQEYKPGYAITGFYALTFSLENSLASYPGYFQVKLSFGTQELGDCSGWGTDKLTEVTLICPSPGYLIIDHSLNCDQNPCVTCPPQGSLNLVFTSSVNGWPIKFSNVSLIFTPQS